jgi:aryl-alcohol dehydrogenase-like predicted oxidoreductase
VAFVEQAIAAGIRHIDTALLYSGGESEQAIGTALSAVSAGCVVATKGGYLPGEGHPDVLQAQIEESLGRLRTGRISLYYLHKVHPQTPIEHSVALIAEARERGQIAHVGLSNVGVAEIRQAREIVPITAVQNHYHLSAREHEDVVDYCTAEGIVFVPYFPLHGDGGGALTEIAERHRASRAQIALAWLLRRSPLMLPIPGTRSLEHAVENLDALEIELDDAEFEALR